MKILQVASSLSPRTGGPAKAVLELSEALARSGQEVSIFSTDHGLGKNEGGGPCEKNGVKIEIFKRAWPKAYFYSPSFRRRLERSIRSFDVVHIHGLWLYPTFISSRICQREAVPYLVRPCGMLGRHPLSHHRLRKKIYSLFAGRKNLNHAQAIHVTTLEEKSCLKDYGLKSPAVVIPLGLQMENYLNLPPPGSFRRHYPHLEGKKIILSLTRISIKKGLDLLVTSFSELVKRSKETHWVIAGPDDEGYGRKLQRWIRQKRIENHVTLTGFLEGEKKLALLRDSDIFCLPSYHENFGLAVVEAMAAGLPVVVSDQVNLHQEIQEAQAGLVTPCRSDAVTSALDQLLGDDNLRKKMGQNGRRLVQEKYQWDKIVGEMLHLYESIARHYSR